MALVKYNPVRDLLSMEREFDKLFSNFSDRFGFLKRKEADEEYDNAVWMPLTDIQEDKDNFKLSVDLPGVPKENVKISFSDGQLSISGERKQEKEAKGSTYHRVERTYGKYYRSFTLPKEIKIDKIDAEYKDGQLFITIPKSEEAKPKELEIKIK